MPTKRARLSKQRSRTHGKAESVELLSLKQTEETLPVPQSIKSLHPEDGNVPVGLGQVTWCVRCGVRPARTSSKTGKVLKHKLCRLCSSGKKCPGCGKLIREDSTYCAKCNLKFVIGPQSKSRAIVTVCPKCKERKLPRSKLCLTCYRKELSERNVQRAGTMALARQRIAQSGNSRKRISSGERAAEELLDRLEIIYLREQLIDRYVVDFILPTLNLAVEVNGRYWHSSPQQQKRDKQKRHFLESSGKKLLVLWTDEMHLWTLQLLDALGKALSPLFMI